jgi:hypothetical protein
LKLATKVTTNLRFDRIISSMSCGLSWTKDKTLGLEIQRMDYDLLRFLILLQQKPHQNCIMWQFTTATMLKAHFFVLVSFEWSRFMLCKQRPSKLYSRSRGDPPIYAENHGRTQSVIERRHTHIPDVHDRDEMLRL